MKITDKLKLTNELVARNRIVLPPMDTLMANGDGTVNDLHIQHYGSRSFGGVGTIIVEATAITPNGRIQDDDLGIWDNAQIDGHKRLSAIIKSGGAIAGIQLIHAGAKTGATMDVRKGGFDCDIDNTIPYQDMTINEIDEVIDQFVSAAQRAKEAGYDFVEIHATHSYLLAQLMSKLNNVTNGDIVERSWMLIKIIKRIATEVDIPMGIRISVHENPELGISVSEYKELLKHIDNHLIYYSVSHGSKRYMTDEEKLEKLYNLPEASKFKQITSKPVFVVGNIKNREDVDKALSANMAGVCIGRALLFNPTLVMTDLLNNDELDEQYKWHNNIWFQPYKYNK